MFRVKGIVGLVEEGRTFDSPQRRMMSGAWPPPAPFGVVGVDRSSLERSDRVLYKPGFVERIGVDRDLDVEPVGDCQTLINRRRRRSPVFMELQAESAGSDLFFQSSWQRRVPLPEKAKIQRECLRRLIHASDVPRAGRAGRRVRPRRGPGATANQGRDAGIECLRNLIRRYEMDVGCRYRRP